MHSPSPQERPKGQEPESLCPYLSPSFAHDAIQGSAPWCEEYAFVSSVPRPDIGCRITGAEIRPTTESDPKSCTTSPTWSGRAPCRPRAGNPHTRRHDRSDIAPPSWMPNKLEGAARVHPDCPVHDYAKQFPISLKLIFHVHGARMDKYSAYTKEFDRRLIVRATDPGSRSKSLVV